jgi:hypothetical protein
LGGCFGRLAAVKRGRHSVRNKNTSLRASAVPGAGVGTATFGATLTLIAPTSTTAGTYPQRSLSPQSDPAKVLRLDWLHADLTQAVSRHERTLRGAVSNGIESLIMARHLIKATAAGTVRRSSHDPYLVPLESGNDFLIAESDT